MVEDHGSTRIDLACPHCQRLFKVRLSNLQFGSDMVCRLCRHEFSAREVSDRCEVQEALARMRQLVKQRLGSAQSSRTPHAIGNDNEEKQAQSSHGATCR
ncbi:hypothetical protein AA309_22880 [Microvirga vignae]|uniref:Uncharacterized protein n=1 Tax=Microvirga vignae TaxID=1225564 RepID=A0A0H1RE79_9HYPH|nr:hypothetical protein AA309_22880 [Microvirga vignae]